MKLNRNVTDATAEMEEILMLLEWAEKWDLIFSQDEAQNIMAEILDQRVDRLEESWWGNGSEKPSPPQLIPLAEKLGFNLEKFLKLISPTSK